MTYTYSADTGLVSQLSVTDGPTYTYTHDGAGRVLIAAIDATHGCSWTWDEAGRLEQTTDLRHTATDYTYDAVGRILTVSGPSGTVTYTR